MDETNYEEITVKRIKADGTTENTEIPVINEHFLSVLINDTPVMRLNCTKDNLKELVAGRLLTEGIIKGADDIFGIYFCKEKNEASVVLKNEIKWEKILRTELSCCTANVVSVTNADSESTEAVRLKKAHWEKKWIFAITESFKEETRLHKKTQGTHTCILARGDKVLFTAEDIGRHNALDKAVGYAVLNRLLLDECIVFTSGRVPLDMVGKVIKAGIPVFVSKSVPTKEAVELAKKCGLTLICRAWPDSMEVVSP